MKNDVIKFLAETPKSKPEQFNQALSLYRRSKNNDQSQVRFMNSLGYSEARLEILLYELKKLHGVTDLQVANAKKQEPRAKSQDEANSGSDSREKAALQEKLLEEVKSLYSSMIDPEADAKELSSYFQDLVERVQKTGIPEPEKNLEPVLEILQNFEEAITAFEQGGHEERVSKMAADVASEAVKAAIDAANAELTTEHNPGAQETSEASEATEDKPAETPEKTEEDTSEATLEDSEATSGDKPVPEIVGKLSDFDVEKESYNSIKAFAADVSDYTGEDPADQKKVTLIAFIQEAKKKLLAS